MADGEWLMAMANGDAPSTHQPLNVSTHQPLNASTSQRINLSPPTSPQNFAAWKIFFAACTYPFCYGRK